MKIGKSIVASILACLGLAACQDTPAPELQTAENHPAASLTVMTFNLRYSTAADGDNAWVNRKDDVLALIQEYGVDILGVQEALPEQMQDLQQGLSEYASLGVGRDPDNQGEFSAIFYSTQRLRLLAGDTFWLSPTPEIPSKGWDAALNRICTWGKFQTQDSGREFFVFNTHFDHMGREARRQSAQLIVDKIAELNPGQLPVILSGDFNLTDQEDPIRLVSQVMQDSFYHAANGHQGPSGTFQDFKTDARELDRIDYIFSNGFDVLTHAHLDARRKSDPARYPSDHFPVLATFHFKGAQ